MSGRARMILAIVGVVLLAVLTYFLLIRPRQNELDQVRTNIETEEARTSQLQAELQRLQDLQERAPELEAQLARFRQLVPNDDDVANFIFLVNDAANAAGVRFVQVTPELPKPPPEGAPVAEVRITIGGRGGYFAVQDFVRRIYNLDRAVRIDNLDFGGEQNEETGETDVQALMTARIFFEPPAR